MAQRQWRGSSFVIGDRASEPYGTEFAEGGFLVYGLQLCRQCSRLIWILYQTATSTVHLLDNYLHKILQPSAVSLPCTGWGNTCPRRALHGTVAM
jgi:hypothetical protein